MKSRSAAKLDLTCKQKYLIKQFENGDISAQLEKMPIVNGEIESIEPEYYLSINSKLYSKLYRLASTKGVSTSRFAELLLRQTLAGMR